MRTAVLKPFEAQWMITMNKSAIQNYHRKATIRIRKTEDFFSCENIFISCILVSPPHNRSYIQFFFKIFFYKILYLISIYLITNIWWCREQFKVINIEPDERLLMFCVCLITLIESITPINVHTFYIKYFPHNTCSTCIHLIQNAKFW